MLDQRTSGDKINLSDARVHLAVGWVAAANNKAVKPDPRFISLKMSISYWQLPMMIMTAESDLELETMTAERNPEYFQPHSLA